MVDRPWCIPVAFSYGILRPFLLHLRIMHFIHLLYSIAYFIYAIGNTADKQ